MSRPQLIRSESVAPLTITRENLHELAVGFAEEAFARTGEVPVMWIVAAGDRLLWIESPWEDEREKLASKLLLALTLKRIKAHAYAFISEAWLTSSDMLPAGNRAEIIAQLLESGEVSLLPKSMRDDVLIVASFDREGGHAMSQFLVTHRTRGPNLLGPRVDLSPDEFDHVEGRLWDLLQ